jgi:hypothetical protein
MRPLQATPLKDRAVDGIVCRQTRTSLGLLSSNYQFFGFLQDQIIDKGFSRLSDTAAFITRDVLHTAHCSDDVNGD